MDSNHDHVRWTVLNEQKCRSETGGKVKWSRAVIVQYGLEMTWLTERMQKQK